MIDKQLQRNSLGVIGIDAFCGSIMQAAAGDFENAIVLGMIAPSMFAIRSDIPSLEMRRDIDDRENAIYQSIIKACQRDSTTTSNTRRHSDGILRMPNYGLY